jgi:hypothetical protein
MPPVLIVCPFSDELVPTRLEAATLDELDQDNLLDGCSDCGQAHKWTREEALLSAAEGWGLAGLAR